MNGARTPLDIRELGYVRRPAPGALFDETSISWRLVGRWPVLAGGQAAVLLQVAHPSVAAGVEQHSSFESDPFGRLERTLDSMLSIAFGSPERREETLATLRGIHWQVVGERADGEAYRALDPDLQLWVWATLVYVALEVERKYVHMLTERDREVYYLESIVMAREFRIPEQIIPSDLGEFNAYVAGTVARVEVTDDARAIAAEVLRPDFWWAPRAVWVPTEWITADLLGEHLRREFGLRPLRRRQRRLLRGLRGATRSVLPRLPDPLLANPLTKRAIA